MKRSLSAIIVVIAALACHRQVFAAGEPSPHAIIDRAMKAGGGVEKIKQYKAVSFKAAFGNGDDKCVFTGIMAGPMLYRVELEVKKARFLWIGNGDRLWIKEGGQPVRESIRGKVESEFNVLLTHFHLISLPDRLLSLKGKDWKLQVVGAQTVNGAKVIQMQANHAKYPETMIWFDQKSGFPVKTAWKPLASSKNDKGEELGELGAKTSRIEYLFDNYQQFDEVWHYTGLRLRTFPSTIDIDLRELKLLKEVDLSAFKKPG